MRYPENVEALAVRLEANGKPELARRARELARKYRSRYGGPLRRGKSPAQPREGDVSEVLV